MLLEIAIFDSYAYGFEYAYPSGHRQNDLRCYYSHPKWRQIPGQYSDDTEMSIAVAELLVEQQEWTPLNVASKFIEVFKRNNQRTGYAARFYEFLCSVKDGAEFLARIRPDSTKSGAAMRANPLGYLPSESQVLSLAKIQAQVTHNTDAGICSAQAIALMAHYFIYNLGPKAELPEYLESKLEGSRFEHDFRHPWKGKVGEQGMESAHAAVQTVVTSQKLSEILTKCVDYGGDTDTVAAMAGGAASCSQEIEQDLPENLYWTLENGPYGRDFLENLDKKLRALKSI